MARRLSDWLSVFNTPGAFTEAVSTRLDSCFPSLAIPWTDREMKLGGWGKAPARALSECTLGVVGVGAIGKAVLRRASVFGPTLLGNDLVPIDRDFLVETGVAMVSLDELLARSDFVSLNCDLNPTSRSLIGRGALERMKASAILINTARGPVVDEAALVDSLRQGRIGGAALDVFEEEPLPPTSPLRKMDQVLLSPHNANSSPRAWERVHRTTIANLLRGLDLAVPASLDHPGDGLGEEGV
jgi:D-3-phosphoglycerate dehydrogenase